MDIRTITAAEATQLIDRQEAHFWDQKSIRGGGAAVRKTAAAFANADGGEVAVGIEDRGQLLQGIDRWSGFPQVEDFNFIHQVLVQQIDPPVPYSIDYLRIEGQEPRGLVALVSIGKSPSVHRLIPSNEVWIRRGAQNLLIVGDKVTNLALAKGAASFEDQYLDRYSFDELVVEGELAHFLQGYSPQTSPETFVRSNRLADVKSGRATVAAAVLYAAVPAAVVPKKCSIKIARYLTKEQEPRRENLQRTASVELPAKLAIDESLNVVTDMLQGLQILEPDGSVASVRYPPEALKEIIVNAVIHRDYNISDDILVTVFDNRVEVRSPGRLPGHITVDNILEERFARNATIVRLIAKYPDAPNKDIGEGLNTAVSKMTAAKLQRPEFIASDDAFTVVLRHTPLKRPEVLVIDYLATHEEVTNFIAREFCGIRSENAMKDVFKNLQRAGKIEPVPGKKGSKSAWRKTAR